VRCITTSDTSGFKQATGNHKGFHKEDEMISVKYEGVGKKKKHAASIGFNIPCSEPANYIKLEQKEQENLLIQLTPSFMGKHFHV